MRKRSVEAIEGAVGGSGCGGEGRDQRQRQSTVRGRCGSVVGVKIGGRSVEIRIEVWES
jgi:hypothetical protein